MLNRNLHAGLKLQDVKCAQQEKSQLPQASYFYRNYMLNRKLRVHLSMKVYHKIQIKENKQQIETQVVGTSNIFHLFRSESILKESSRVLSIDKPTDQTTQSTNVESRSRSHLLSGFIVATDIKWEKIPSIKLSCMTKKFSGLIWIKDIFSQKIGESPYSRQKLFPLSWSHKTLERKFT